jgi:hypothetical protein
VRVNAPWIPEPQAKSMPTLRLEFSRSVAPLVFVPDPIPVPIARDEVAVEVQLP